jgi:hypothetical protein
MEGKQESSHADVNDDDDDDDDAPLLLKAHVLAQFSLIIPNAITPHN